MNPKLSETIAGLPAGLSEERRKVLQPLIDHIASKKRKGETVRLNFICTHNSRRSLLAQVWAQTMAFHFKIDGVFCYSGGTETTALFPKVADTLAEHGFNVLQLCKTENPVYAVKYSMAEAPVICFSKKYDDMFNPGSHFVAIMTCSSADHGCPFVSGAEARFSVKYEDPKLFDDTDQQALKYSQRSLEIANEMWWVFSSLAQQ
jgi:arsenate reductase